MPDISHSPKTIDEYLAALPVKQRKTLQHLRSLIRKTAPEALEVISYQMPAFKFYGILAYFAAFKEHSSLFIPVKVLERHKEELKPYLSGKATLRFPTDQCLPDELVIMLIKESMKLNLEKKQKRKIQ
jgi:uncharacterized protein YdhG (YjbR/CyaY superfamily)